MENRQKKGLVRLVGEAVRFDVPMDQYTTFQAGGEAEALYKGQDLDELQRLIAYLNKEQISYLVMGKGSNVLVRDEGVRGVIILLRGKLASVGRVDADDSALTAGGGGALTDLLTYCRDSRLGGLEFLAGVPGTIGGAVAMNSGAFGYEIGEWVREIHVISPKGDVVTKERSQLRFSYRSLNLEKGEVIVGAVFDVKQENKGVVGERILEYLKRRKEQHPLEYPSAGSVFRNPPNDFAGRLIEIAGLKGKRVGGAMISYKHANFIINTGGAKANDILALLSLARQTVKNETGIQLEPEIKVVGG
jgi:UDP-N-acetylmuramate dehydrogenase